VGTTAKKLRCANAKHRGAINVNHNLSGTSDSDRSYLHNSPNNRSRGEAFVAMVQPTNLRERNNLPALGWVDRASYRTILIQ
jgi:hypothetical protein